MDASAEWTVVVGGEERGKSMEINASELGVVFDLFFFLFLFFFVILFCFFFSFFFFLLFFRETKKKL